VGVGDLTSGLLLACLLKGMTNRDALEFTAAAVYEVMLETKKVDAYELQLVAAQDRIAKPEHRFTAKSV
jgi:pyridoxine kinase